MIEYENLIIGTVIILINLIPLILKKYKYLLLTAIITFIIAFVSTLI